MKELVDKYNQGRATEEETVQLEHLIVSGEASISDLKVESSLFEKLNSLKSPSPTAQMDERFYQMLAAEKGKSARQFSWFDFSAIWKTSPALRLASAILLLATGFGIGYLTNQDQDAEINQLTSEVTEMKEMMMLTLLEKESPSDRLKAVHLTSDMSTVSDKVTDALIHTLNKDENVNVRLEALEALYPYADNSNVRMALIASIRNQESPLVQVALAEMMVVLQEKKSVDELKHLLEKEETPDEIKLRLQESIQTII